MPSDFSGLRAELMDCLQVNLAILADLRHGPGSHVALGAELTGESTLDRRLDEASRLLGLQVVKRHDDAVLRDRATDELQYAVADAFDLSWVPYAGHQHMEHSFLFRDDGDACEVVDGYHNGTQWGNARPGVWRVSWDELPRATVVELAFGELPAPRAISPFVSTVDVEATCADVEQMVLDIWLLARSRGLHAVWLDSAAFEEHVREWNVLAAHSYVAMRRVLRGGALVPSVAAELTRLLARDEELTRVRSVVAAELSDVLGNRVHSGRTPLREFPGFSSFRLVDVIERVEARLGVEVAAEALTPESLRDLDSLCVLFTGSAAAGSAR
ncbi:acyl carrier protein [Lentzea sp. NPDC042327]|uniref:acyl carrier protein n=1 Tax=Lentzea sp. NPDC042327 TaxID=3154801 RepID=UPI0033D8CC57